MTSYTALFALSIALSTFTSGCRGGKAPGEPCTVEAGNGECVTGTVCAKAGTSSGRLMCLPPAEAALAGKCGSYVYNSNERCQVN